MTAKRTVPVVLIAVIGFIVYFLPGAAAVASPGKECITCHGDSDYLKNAHEDISRLFVSEDLFSETTHSVLGCTACHMGQEPADSEEDAHKGLIKKPDAPEALPETCSQCHEDIVHKFDKSLHSTLYGQRAAPVHAYGEQVGLELFNNYCSKCHASCSDCHLKRLDDNTEEVISDIKGHRFSSQPEIWACVDCHTQTGFTYTGWRELPGSVHYDAGMECNDCHDADEMHGDGEKLKTMKNAVKVTCEQCHEERADYNGFPVVQRNQYGYAHEVHGDRLDCSACHTAWYMNCVDCHLKTPPIYDVGEMHTDRYYLGKNDKGKITTFTETPLPKVADDVKLHAFLPKVRHSWVSESKTCEFCHTDAALYPQKGDLLSGDFLEPETLERIIIDTERFGESVHGSMGVECKDCHTTDAMSKCSECHDPADVQSVLNLRKTIDGKNKKERAEADRLRVLFHYEPSEVLAETGKAK